MKTMSEKNAKDIRLFINVLNWTIKKTNRQAKTINGKIAREKMKKKIFFLLYYYLDDGNEIFFC